MVIVTLTLFEREVVKLLKVSASQLLDKNIEVFFCVYELKAFLNQKFAFKIAIGSFNIKNKSYGYFVSRGGTRGGSRGSVDPPVTGTF
ncbi:hypothetical protein Hanom_Chr09g00766761 [Helianthus anomalus]